MSLSKSQAKKITDRMLRAASLDEVSVRVSSSSTGNTRFAVNQPTTTGDVENTSITVTASVDGRSASASGNATDDATIERLVKQAEELARIAPPDPEYMPPLGPQKYVKVKAKDGKASRMGGVERAAVAKACIAVAKARGLEGSGLITHGSRSFTQANKAGLFAFYESSSVSLTSTCRTPDGTGSGRAGFSSHAAAGLDATAVAERAADKAERSKNPRGIDPGEYTVILEPQAVTDLLGFMRRAMSQRSVDEGRSYFAGTGGKSKVGEKLFDERITIWSDPANKNNPSSPIGGGGLPASKTTWIHEGVLKALSNGRYWAKKTGTDVVQGGRSMFMLGGPKTLEELLGDVKKGILVTRFWYNRMLQPRSILVTGLTRDGTFMVEDGKITHSVKNMRYNESPLTLLKNVVALGKPERAGMSRRVAVVPPMVVRGFHFASTSDAV